MYACVKRGVRVGVRGRVRVKVVGEEVTRVGAGE